MDINQALNEVMIKLFHNISAMEEEAIRAGAYSDVTANDMHVMEAIGMRERRSMTYVSKLLHITTGTLTISVNSLVKKGYVQRERSESDRRVVLVSLTERGQQAYLQHQAIRGQLADSMVGHLTEEEKRVLEKALSHINQMFAKDEAEATQ